MNYLYIVIGLAFVLAGLVGYFIRQLVANQQILNTRREAQRLLSEATIKQEEMLREAKLDADKVRRTASVESKELNRQLQRLEKRLDQKEEALDRKRESAERRERDVENRAKNIELLKSELEGVKQEQIEKLESLSGISQTNAERMLFEELENEVKEAAARHVREWEAEIKSEADERVQRILATAIQRCATDVVSQTAISMVSLPSDEMKGRLIGREGRNIRSLEQATGVDLIIDDTPETVTISSFDPIRREVARIALNKLILDGRIHPARIEDVVEKAKEEIEATIRREGEQATYEASVVGLHPELIKLLGKLKFRTSYGQNVLAHSLEVAFFSGMLADEIGIDATIARKAGLLHDIGKAVDHDVEGPHALIGANLVKQWDKSEVIVQAVSEHHGEASTTSTLGFIVAAADGISGSRPGARRESMQQYIKRIKELEDVAGSFAGVEKTFAIQAGREVRVLVKSKEIDDLASMRLARDISQKIEQTLTYPGQIKIMVVRETIAVDYAK
jgi:ribonuclease Y